MNNKKEHKHNKNYNKKYNSGITTKNWSTVRSARTLPTPNLPTKTDETQYTNPKTEYKYHMVPWEAFLDSTYTGYKSIRSSFIPYIHINGERHWVLGSFHDYPRDILMDFGGSCIHWDPPRKYVQKGQKQMRNYQHQFGCAMLELNEESKGLLVQPVLRSLGTAKPIVYRGTDEKKREYVWFVMVPLVYEEIKNIGSEFEKAPYVTDDEEFGPVDFYKESEFLDGTGNFRTTRNLTDFIRFLKEMV